MITDPLFTQGYSQFCYELPFMPGTTQYLDTPVVPTSAFAGAGYNNVDCAYPDATPAIAEVDGDGVGPWVSKSGVTLTITALGNQTVPNNAYSGPSAITAPFNQKTITRHYGFGAQCTSPTAGSTTCNTLSSVTIGGRPATITSWSDTAITVAVPSGVPNCGVQQQAQYGGSTAQCGQLAIAAGNGQKSVDTVTVTIGGKAPTHVAASGTIQSAIDAANPGDMIIVDPTCNSATGTVPCTTATGIPTAGITSKTTAAHNELLLMWKPIRLQGVGAASSIVNANTHPAGKLDPWRRQVVCLFGIAIDGTPISASNPYDSTGSFTCSPAMQFQVDRLPLEATVGWDASLNGNLAEMLQEPGLMGALEGAGITVLAKGVDFNGGNPWDATLLGGFPTGTTLLTAANCLSSTGTNPFPSNFQCNPSSIDGLGITNSSQGGGGIFVHGWGHNLQIANNRVYNNAGTLSGGINVGQGEFPPPYLQGSATNAPPGSCQTSTVTNMVLPYCHNLNVNVHNNYIALNSSTGDELFSATPAGAGGVSFCTGSDYYKFNYNWVCGNLSSGDGGGLGHLGMSYNGDIEYNWILFNQSTNPTIAANGGGMIVMGAPDADPPCGATVDTDCVPAPGSIGPSDGVGPNLTINANLILGNAAESGSGGGIAFQNVNGSDVVSFPTTPANWWHVTVTNNIISNNVAGWDGAGVSLLDAFNLDLINNTVASNSTTATSGVLFNTIGAPLASTAGTNCTSSSTTSCPQPAGLVTIQNSAVLTANLPASITCPAGHYAGTTATNGTCRTFSYPQLMNDIFWQNSAYYVGVGALSAQYQQNIVSLYNAFTTTLAPSQSATGACVAASYWDIGVRGDLTVAGHESGVTLAPTYSVLTDATDYPGLNNLGSNPTFISQYCDGSRTPPEFGASGWAVPPGIADATVPNPIFNLTPVATVDEGNNWVNMRWGPLSLTNPSVTGGANGNYGGGAPLGNYSLVSGSPAIDYVPTSAAGSYPTTDFFGNPRPDPAVPNRIDIGAIEFQGSGVATTGSITPSSGAQGTSVNVTITGTLLSGATNVNVSGTGVTVSNVVAVSATTVTATFTIAPNATLSARNVTVTTPAGTSPAVTFTVVAPPAPTLTSIVQNNGLRGTVTNVQLTGTNFTPTGSSVVMVPAVAGVSISNVTWVSGTQINATITSTVTAPLGAVNIGVTTPGGASNTLPFTVTGPVVTSITPNTGLRGTTVNVTVAGSGFTGATASMCPATALPITSFTVVSDTQITASFVIGNGATAGARNVTVASPAGTSNAVTFTVTVPPAGLFSIDPNTGARGTAQAVVLTGISLTGATAVNVNGGGITVSGVTVVSDTQVNATFTISATAALTARNVTVTTPTGTTTPVTFTVVLPGTPVLNSITPASGFRGTPTTVTLTGSNFTAAGTTVNVTAPANGFTITGVTVANATTIMATFNTTGAATIGPRSIYVTTPGGTSGTVSYNVRGPVLTSISPASSIRGNVVSVTLTGSGLTGTTAITVPGGGVAVSALTVVNDSTVTATFTISATAAGTARNVTVTAPGGTSNAVTFNVTTPPAPTLTNISPATGVRGTVVPVTLTGTNLLGAPPTLNITGGGVTISNLSVTSATTADATLTITATAALSVRNVSITLAGQTSNTVPFTVQGATLVSITPNSATHPATGTLAVPVTITGNNLTGATGLNGLGGGVSLAAGTFTVVNSTTITATLNITSGATVTIRNIGVATPIGNTNTVPFTVN